MASASEMLRPTGIELGRRMPESTAGASPLSRKVFETSAPNVSSSFAVTAGVRPQALSSSARTSLRSRRAAGSFRAPLFSEVLIALSALDWRLERALSDSSGMNCPSSMTP